MASIRVFLPTCRRGTLLRRSLASLLSQTHTDWVCELHNDAPEDEAPAKVLAELAPGDGRIAYFRHERSWGAVASFNRFFAGGPEPYGALLEDDNWWEPALLATLLAELAGRPTAALAWANMRIWQEGAHGAWTDTGTTVWPAGGPPRAFVWPVLLQAFDALHSNGAMVFRRPDRGGGLVPPSTPFAIIEPVRERALAGALVFVPEVLAHYARTRRSARSGDRRLWAEGQLLLAGSFLEQVPLTPSAWDELFALCRRARPRRTNLLVFLALAGVRRAEILSRATAADAFAFAWSFAGNLRANLGALRFRTTHRELWEWLRAETEARTAEARAAGWTALDAGSLFAKHGPAARRPHEAAPVRSSPP